MTHTHTPTLPEASSSPSDSTGPCAPPSAYLLNNCIDNMILYLENLISAQELLKLSQFTPLLTPHFSRGLSAPCGISYVTGGQADSSPCHPSASPDPVRKIQRLSQPLRPRKNDLFLGFREPSFIYLRTWVSSLRLEGATAVSGHFTQPAGGCSHSYKGQLIRGAH